MPKKDEKSALKKAKSNYDDRIIAFVDIMGFQDMVDESVNNPDQYAKIKDALHTFKNLKKDKADPLYRKDIKVTTFSDSLVISYPADYNGGLFWIILDLIYLQLIFSRLGVIIRGGIAIGKLRHTREEIFGPAMNEAYWLESKKAIYPRIVIEEETINAGLVRTYDKSFPIEYSLECEKEDVKSLLKQDDDGFFFLDFLRQYDEFPYPEDYYQMLAAIGNVIQQGKILAISKPNLSEKYDWLERYFDSVVAEIKTVDEFSDSNILSAPRATADSTDVTS